MKKIMTQGIVAALMLGAVTILPSCGCGCKREEVSVQMPAEMPKAVDAQDVNVQPVEAVPAAVPAQPADAEAKM